LKLKTIFKNPFTSSSNGSLLGKEFKNTSYDNKSDHEYFSCENTGASSPSLHKREFINPFQSEIIRSWSFHNITECSKLILLRKRMNKSYSFIEKVNLPYQRALHSTVTFNYPEELKDCQPKEGLKITQKMEDAMKKLNLICTKAELR